MPGDVSPASVRDTGSSGRTCVRDGRSPCFPGAVPRRGHPRRGATRPGYPLLSAGRHRRRSDARTLDSQRLAEPVAAGVGQSVAGRENGSPPSAAPDTRRDHVLRAASREPRRNPVCRRLSPHLRSGARSGELAPLVRGHLSRTGRASGEQRRRSGDVSTVRRAVRRPHRAVAQLLVTGRRLRHFPAERQGLAQRSGSQLHRVSSAGVSREPAQAARQDAEALFPRYRPGLLVAGYPSVRAAPIASVARADLRDLGCFGDIEAPDQSGLDGRHVVLSGPETEQRSTSSSTGRPASRSSRPSLPRRRRRACSTVPGGFSAISTGCHDPATSWWPMGATSFSSVRKRG